MHKKTKVQFLTSANFSENYTITAFYFILSYIKCLLLYMTLQIIILLYTHYMTVEQKKIYMFKSTEMEQCLTLEPQHV